MGATVVASFSPSPSAILSSSLQRTQPHPQQQQQTLGRKRQDQTPIEDHFRSRAVGSFKIMPMSLSFSSQILEAEQADLAISDVATVTDTTGNNFAEASSASWSSTETFANALGYVLGLGSLLLYTPIAVRVYRQKHADGLTMSTWWLKLSSYTVSDIYYFKKAYPLSTYIETLTITIEAAVILGLVAHFQDGRLYTFPFAALSLLFVTGAIYGLTVAPPDVLAMGQVGAALLNSAALVPQFVLNYQQQTKGDYSPTTAALASTGCSIRLFTISQLADNDPVLLGSFGLALILNFSLLLQILYYGVFVEHLTIRGVFIADLGTPKKKTAVQQLGQQQLQSEVLLDTMADSKNETDTIGVVRMETELLEYHAVD